MSGSKKVAMHAPIILLIGIVIFYTEMRRKVVLWCFFGSETSEKIHNSTFQVKGSRTFFFRVLDFTKNEYIVATYYVHSYVIKYLVGCGGWWSTTTTRTKNFGL